MNHLDVGIWAMVVIGILGGLTAIAWAVGRVLSVLSRLRVARAQERLVLGESAIKRQALDAKRRQDALEQQRAEVERQTELMRAKQELERTKNATVAEDLRLREGEVQRLRMDVARLEGDNRRLVAALPEPPPVDTIAIANEVLEALRREGVFKAMDPQPIIAALDAALGDRLREAQEQGAQLIVQQLQGEIANVQSQVTEVANLIAGAAGGGVEPAVVGQIAAQVEVLGSGVSTLLERLGADGQYLAQSFESLHIALAGREHGSASAQADSAALVEALRETVITSLEDSLEAFRVSFLEAQREDKASALGASPEERNGSPSVSGG